MSQIHQEAINGARVVSGEDEAKGVRKKLN